MALKYGIIGLPNVGKSTLFNALTNSNAIAENFPFCTIEPNTGMVPVYDERLEVLASIVKPNKIMHTYIEFMDIAGLVAGASKGEGLGNKFLGNIREVDAVVHVVRCFAKDEIQHVSGKIDPTSDKEVIDYELQMKDLETVSKRMSKLKKFATADKNAKEELNILQYIEDGLNRGISVKNSAVYESNEDFVRSLQLLTTKPVLYVANIDEETLQKGTNKFLDSFKELMSKEEANMVTICVSLEEQIARLNIEDKAIFLEEYNLKNSALDILTNKSYKLLDLITYFTAGVQEVRAWTIKKGFKAPQAAGVIHTDFEKGFIKAEVIKYCDFVKYKSEIACKEAGKMFIEGKNYHVQDGDVIHFRFNV